MAEDTQLQLTNPADESVCTIETLPCSQVQPGVDKARAAQPAWAACPLAERADLLGGLTEMLLQRQDALARLIATDMGKPLAAGRGEVAYVASQVRFFCDQATDWLGPELASSGYIQFAPLGVVGVISPWNVPLIAPLLAILPALLAGNAVVFKPSEYATRTGQAIAEMLQELLTSQGHAADLVHPIIGGKMHGQALVDSDVDMISFTGSESVGKRIMQDSAAQVRPLILELGGLDAAIVLADADLSEAARQLVRNNCNNTGQICCAAKRVFVEQAAFDTFLAAAVEASQQVQCGHPEEAVDMGPLVGQFQLHKVEAAVADAVDKGARVLTGGERPQKSGYFYPSTILADVNLDMSIMQSEAFGPVLPIMPVPDEQTAVRLANDTTYGLTGSVWTADVQRGQRVLEQLEVGVGCLNKHGVGPAGTPFGGTKHSGLGRIKHREGMRAYCNTKMISLDGV